MKSILFWTNNLSFKHLVIFCLLAITYPTQAQRLMEKGFVYEENSAKNSKSSYLFDATIAEAPLNNNNLMEAISNIRIEVYNNTLQHMEYSENNHSTPFFHYDLKQGNHYTLLFRKPGYEDKWVEAHVNIDGCILCIEGLGDNNPDVKVSLPANSSIGTLLSNIEMKRLPKTKASVVPDSILLLRLPSLSELIKIDKNKRQLAQLTKPKSGNRQPASEIKKEKNIEKYWLPAPAIREEPNRKTTNNAVAMIGQVSMEHVQPLPENYTGYTVEIGIFDAPLDKENTLFQKSERIFFQKEADQRYHYYSGSAPSPHRILSYYENVVKPYHTQGRICIFKDGVKQYTQ